VINESKTRNESGRRDESKVRAPWIPLLAALGAGLALRLFFFFKYPSGSDDGTLYESMGHNWFAHGTYGLDAVGRIIPSDIRTPGYPLFTAVIHLLGRGQTPLLLAQIAVDLCTCVLAGMLAGMLSPASPSGRTRRRVMIAAVWLAALCPFLADYAAVNLTEVLTTFFTAMALVALTAGAIGNETLSWNLLMRGAGENNSASRKIFLKNSWFVGGLAVGCGTMVRPESPLVLVAPTIVLVWRLRRRADWPKLIRAGALTAVGFVIPLIPWTARNAISLHEFQPLAPQYAQGPGESVPTGYYAWTNTWLVRYRDVDPFIWTLGEQPISLDGFPPIAFDTPEERERASALLDQYNKKCCEFTDEWNAQFTELARERTARHPLRTYITVPFQRALTLWFTPRVEMMGYNGDLWPVHQSYEDDPAGFYVTALLGAIGIIYVALAFGGTAKILQKHLMSGPQIWGAAILIAFCVVRTTFLTRVQTPEPRYVLECFPVVYALGAFLWAPRNDSSSAST
jgi:4-amino-4-deoxy-L-arabinose transferase-like glycosyltransferase